MADSLKDSSAFRDMMQELTQPGAQSPFTMGDVTQFFNRFDSIADRAKDFVDGVPSFRLYCVLVLANPPPDWRFSCQSSR